MERLSPKNQNRLAHLGIIIATMRRKSGMNQYELAKKAKISRSLLSTIEAPGMTKNFSLEVLFKIADALEADPISILHSAEVFSLISQKPTI